MFACLIMGATSVLSSMGYRGLRALGVVSLGRRLQRGGTILCYHNVLRRSDTPALGDPGLHLAVERFDAQMRWLARHYRVVPLREMVARLRAGRSLRGIAALTFDDGYAGVLTHAVPILRELRLPATVFVVAAAPTVRNSFWWDHPAALRATGEAERDRRLRELRGDQDAILRTLAAAPEREQVPELRPAGWGALLAATVDGIEIGAHSLHHRSLTALTPEELDADLTECRQVIARHTGVLSESFAYPYGLWDRGVRDAVRRAGFTCAVTLDRGSTTARTDPWALPRVNIAAGLEPAAFESWVAGVRP